MDAKQKISDHLPQAEGFWERQIEWLRRKKADLLSGNIKDYYSDNLEMQVRMHEIMVTGYSQWQTLPTSKTELWAALHQMGIDTPPSIEDILYNTDEGQDALEKFACKKCITTLAAIEIQSFNTIQNYINDLKATESLWGAHLPLLYGELIEHYGDEQGRARMGLGMNPKPAIDVMRELEILADSGVNLDETQIKDFANRIPAALAAPFINNLIKLRDQDNYEFSDETHTTYMNVVDALLKRPEVRKALFENDHIEINAQDELNYKPPLLEAFLYNNNEIFDLMIKNGANVNQSFSFTGEDGIHSLYSFRIGSMGFVSGEIKPLASAGLKAVSQTIKNLFSGSAANTGFSEEIIERHRQRISRIDMALNQNAPTGREPEEFAL